MTKFLISQSLFEAAILAEEALSNPNQDDGTCGIVALIALPEAISKAKGKS